MAVNSGTELEKDIQNIKAIFNRCYTILRTADRFLSTSNKKYSYRGKFIFRQMKMIFVKY